MPWPCRGASPDRAPGRHEPRRDAGGPADPLRGRLSTCRSLGDLEQGLALMAFLPVRWPSRLPKLDLGAVGSDRARVGVETSPAFEVWNCSRNQSRVRMGM